MRNLFPFFCLLVAFMGASSDVFAQDSSAKKIAFLFFHFEDTGIDTPKVTFIKKMVRSGEVKISSNPDSYKLQKRNSLNVVAVNLYKKENYNYYHLLGDYILNPLITQMESVNENGELQNKLDRITETDWIWRMNETAKTAEATLAVFTFKFAGNKQIDISVPLK